MNPLPTRYALLRDRSTWDAALPAGLVVGPGGAITLAPLPRPDVPVALPPPFDVPPSGLACAPCGSRFVSVTAAGQVVYADSLCQCDVALPHDPASGLFDQPRGLAWRPGRGLYVADSGHARIVVLDDPLLQVVAMLRGAWSRPTSLALDAAGRLALVDGATGRVWRLGADGAPDTVFDTALATSGLDARFIGFDPDGILHVSTATGALARFAPDGSALPPLASIDPALHAGAMAFDGGRLYLADIATGRIQVLDAASGAALGTLPDFVGPVSAMVLCAASELWIKTGDDDTRVHCPAGAAFATGASFEVGPLDAGARDAWWMIGIDAVTPLRCMATLSLAIAATPSPGPAAADWVELPAAAGLVARLFGRTERYLWLRVSLQGDGRSSPRLEQVRAETPGEDYRDELPAMYSLDDGPDGPLGRFLALMRVQFDRSERLLDGVPQRLSIDFARDADLAWIAAWLGFVLPDGLTPAEQRVLLHRVIDLYDRRGTRQGLAEFVHVYTGLRPRIEEDFAARHVWQLGATSRLGFDTALAPENPLGMVVPDPLTLGTGDPAFGCAEPARVTIGSVVVGADGPLASAQIGSPLFSPSAHRFRVTLPAWQAPSAALRDAVRDVLDAEKPAHTDYALCIVESAMRVGLQSCVGVDTYVADRPRAAPLDGLALGTDSFLSPIDSRGRMGSQARLGVTTLLA